MRFVWRLSFGILLVAIAGTSAFAQDAFLKGKTVRILLSAGVAGGYAEYGRLLSQHMGNHIAGKPDFIVQSMPGAGGSSAAGCSTFSRSAIGSPRWPPRWKVPAFVAMTRPSGCRPRPGSGPTGSRGGSARAGRGWSCSGDVRRTKGIT